MSKDKLTIEVSNGVNTSKITTTEEGITLTSNNIEVKADNKGIVGEPGQPGVTDTKAESNKAKLKADNKDVKGKSGAPVEPVVISPDTKSEANLTVQPEKIQLKGDSGTKKSKADSDFDKLVEDTINGKYGTGRERMLALGKRYAEVQTEIVKRLRSGK